ncbi:acyl-CoA synthetase [Sphingopyxis sp.]|uniref:acyl-CoA synthetase n=1 Tax=Sphingopyxis sp. TaxID=1908224 RepID=UPI002B47D7E7|nr:acyl-CoA synthetase [Sphingopyxis sp.]HJS10523.1 acyl-CoA synthetase [Sphingopyxis sp.]
MHPSHHAVTDPSKAAYIMAATGTAVDYATLEERSNRLAHIWRSQGYRPGDTLAVVLENHEWFFPLIWSAQRSGLYYACLSHTLSAADLAYILVDSGARGVVGSRKTLPLLEAASANGAAWQVFLVDGDGGSGAIDLVAAAAGFPPTPIADECAGTDMLYSSGTTGRPKGIRRPFEPGAPIASDSPMTSVARSRFHMGAGSIYLSPAPLYHAGPLRWALMVQRMGGTVVVMDRFDAEEALRLIETYKVTASQWVPTHFVRMLQLPEAVRDRYDVASLRAVFHAAAPCPIPVKEAMLDWWGPIIHEYYGGTENNGMTMIGPDEWLERKGSVGRAFVGTIHICDEEGHDVPAGSEGSVFFEGGPAFAYHNDEEKTRSATNAKGWTTLGDIGRLDADGYLFLTDRKSFMIISGGVNIYPQEIENCLALHPKVRDVAVIGAPDPDMGEKVVAVVELRNPADASDALKADLKAYLRERLGGVKTPRQIDFTGALPREPTGKLFKRLLRDQYRSADIDR